MKVLLINPEFPDTYWSFRHALPFEGKRCAFPPLGLLTVSALLPPAWERRLVDLNVRQLRSADIEWADIVMATAMLVQKDSLKQVVRRCKAKGKRVVVGGPYVSTTLEALPEADHIFVGEAETTLAQLSEANRLYEERFGHIYIVCASGKDAEEMLDLCHQRIHNDPAMELAVAAEEQRKIMRLRLAKLLMP